MSHATKIFISHSAHSDEDSAFLFELEARLKAEGLEPYCDRKRLEVGDEWRNELYTAIGCCHAAVVLLTRQALDVQRHPWVFKECAMFTLLKWADQEFPLVPVAMTGVTTDDVKGSPFESLLLSEIQTGSAADLDRLIERIKAKLKGITCSAETEPLHHHHRRIASRLLALRETHKHIFKEIVEGHQSSVWDPLDRELPYRVARVLLTLEPETVVDALQDVFPALGPDAAELLIRFLAPFWLELPAVARLEDAMQTDQRAVRVVPDESVDGPEPPRRVFGLNACDQDMAVLQVNRAGYLKKDLYGVIQLPKDSGTDELGRFASHICAEMRQRAGRATGNAVYPDRRTRNQAKKYPTFVIVPAGTDKEVVTALRKRFWPMVFIVLTADDDPADWDIQQFEMLDPPLAPDYEYTVYDTLDSVLRRTNSIIEGG